MAHTMTGLYTNGMHDFILDEMELGTRVAQALDDEACGFGPLFDLSYKLYMEQEMADGRE
jgi:hypothetical protein